MDQRQKGGSPPQADDAGDYWQHTPERGSLRLGCAIIGHWLSSRSQTLVSCCGTAALRLKVRVRFGLSADLARQRMAETIAQPKPSSVRYRAALSLPARALPASGDAFMIRLQSVFALLVGTMMLGAAPARAAGTVFTDEAAFNAAISGATTYTPEAIAFLASSYYRKRSVEPGAA